MKRILPLICLALLTSCNYRQPLSENEAICNISGEGFDVPHVRVCLVWSDMWNGDEYQQIRVRDGRFDADVVLDTNQVYEICIPHPEYGYSAYRTAEFFYSKDGVRFGQETGIDGDRVVVSDPAGDNRTYYGYKNHRDSLFMGWYADLMESQDSLDNIGKMYDPHWRDLLEKLNDATLPQSARDSITLEVNKMSMSGENRTPEGQKWMQEWNDYRSSKQAYDLRHLNTAAPDHIGLYMIMDNIHISQGRNDDISDWLNLYHDRFSNVSESSRMHVLISEAESAAAMVEGRHFVDFTLPDRYGKEHTLSELIDGKVAVLELWASWCRSCRVNARSFKPLYEKYDDAGFTVVGVAREYRDKEKWHEALDMDAYPWPNMVAMEEDHSIWTLYGTPDAAGSTFLIDKDGVIIKINPSAQDVEEYLKSITKQDVK